MRNGLSLDLSKVQPYASLSELDKMEGMVNYAHTTVHEKTGAGNDFLGWLDLPVNYDYGNIDDDTPSLAMSVKNIEDWVLELYY